jgi:hypothetical protein
LLASCTRQRSQSFKAAQIERGYDAVLLLLDTTAAAHRESGGRNRWRLVGRLLKMPAAMHESMSIGQALGSGSPTNAAAGQSKNPQERHRT